MGLANDVNLSIAHLAPLIRRRKLSPVELTGFALDRIDRLQPRLNAFITVTAQIALQQAKEAEDEKLKAVSDNECLAYSDVLRKGGRRLAAEALQPVRTARTVRVRDGKVSILDGPFAETKEHLAGFYLIEAEDMDAALELAAKIPPARVGSIEVRPVRELQAQ